MKFKHRILLIKNVLIIKTCCRILLSIILTLLPSFLVIAQVSVVTQHNNNSRTGLNGSEKTLCVSNINKNIFGKIGAYSVDDQIYAQPLIVSGLNMPGAGTRNVLFIATLNNTLYAFDAEDYNSGRCFWKVNLNAPEERPVKNTDFSACNGNYTDFSGNIGIVGTPVIDTVRQTIYLVSKSYTTDSICHQRLHAINLLDGTERPNSPVLIAASVEGTGSGSEKGIIAFRAMTQNQRAALLLSQDWFISHGQAIAIPGLSMVG